MATNDPRGRTNLLIGMLLVGLGGLFLLGQIFHVNLWQFFWPFFVIVPGLLFFVGMVLGGKPAGPLAIPGSIVTMVGLLLLYQSITNHWESWAYAWALVFPTAVGIGLVINGTWSDLDRLVHTGMRWITMGVIIFLIGGLFFELILNISHSLIGDVLWPGLLIAAGIYLVMRRGRRASKAEVAPREAAPREAAPIEEQPPQPAATEFEPLDSSRLHKD